MLRAARQSRLPSCSRRRLGCFDGRIEFALMPGALGGEHTGFDFVLKRDLGRHLIELRLRIIRCCCVHHARIYF